MPQRTSGIFSGTASCNAAIRDRQFTRANQTLYFLVTFNLISFTTKRYRAEPLVITGPGAGPEVTAAGILNDIQFLATTEATQR